MFSSTYMLYLEQRTNHKRISDIKYQTLQIAPSQFNFEDAEVIFSKEIIYICYIPP